MKRAATAVAIFLVAVAPFAMSARHGFAPCDDYCYVKQKSEVYGGLSAMGAAWAFRHLGDGIWMPGTWLSYQLDCTVFGVNPAAMHVHSLAVHGLNAVLLWWLLVLLMPGRSARFGIAAMAALVWAVHPLRAESVVWIASRKDVLSMFWLLSSLIAWVWGRRRQGRAAVVGYVASLFFVCVGAMCKPSVNIYPGLVFLLDWLVLGVTRPAADRANGGGTSSLPWWLIYVLPVCIGVAITAEGAWAQYTAGGFETQQLPLYGRALNFAAAFGLYIWNTLCPLNLAVDCVQKWPSLPRGLALGVPAALAAVWYFWRKWSQLRSGWHVVAPDWIFAGLAWFCGALLPFMTGFGIHALADRFTYIPSVGLSLMVIGLWDWWLRGNRGPMAHSCMLGLNVMAITCLGVFSWRQTSFWKDERTLYEHTLEVDGEDNYRAQILLGVYSWNVDHDLDAAARRLEKVRETSPSNLDDFRHVYMFVLAESGRMDEAEKLLREMTEGWDRHLQQMEARGGGTPSMPGMDFGGHASGGDLPRNLRLARAAYYIAVPELRSAAEEELSRIEAKSPRYRLLYYLKGRLAWENGDKESARRYWRDMLSKGEGEQYLRCEFVKRFL